ncbi:MAG: M1 family metallopeptidase [Flavobacteriales bacterium]|nr:M1 family metallopeptidase [Flavobacteriales bacterium]
MLRMPFVVLLIAAHAAATAQLQDGRDAFNKADTLRGSLGPYRAWWNVVGYDVTVKPDFVARSVEGRTIIAFDAVKDGQRLQIDLQQPLLIDSILTDVATYKDGTIGVSYRAVPFHRDGNVAWVELPQPMKKGEASTITIHYHGIPRAARNPPWDGGWIWKTDARGNPWMSVACQGLGASVWYPCKDHQSDEPEQGANLRIIVPDSLQAIGNGGLRSTVRNGDGTSTWHWQVRNPINTYNLVPYIGKYVQLSDTFAGTEGNLDLAFWILQHHAPWGQGEFRGNREEDEQWLRKAATQFKQVPEMLGCFEEWFGPYPFYADGYKLVESPHLGMEHQSAIAYGNGFMNGYRGSDLSGTGHGLNWDYIIIHESGHEWFGNSITTADIADMWVHEGFTDYSETIFTECQQGKQAAEEYVIGLRRNIRNDKPIIGPYGVNEEGSGDMYYKGANLIHMIRHIVGDSTFKAMLLEINRRFKHSIVTSAQIEEFMIDFNERTKSLLNKGIFDQYLRTNKVPVLEWGRYKNRAYARWSNCVPGFSLPVRLSCSDGELLTPLSTWRSLPCDRLEGIEQADRNWYVMSRAVGKRALKREISLQKRRIPHIKP